MSTTLTYGRVRPATGDAASTWMQALEGNVTTDDAHTHNGTDSALIPVSSLKKSDTYSTITSAQWSSDGGGNYSKVVTIPTTISGASINSDVIAYNLVVKINTAGSTYGDVIYPSIDRESASTFTVRVNDNTLDLIIYYV